MTRSYHGAVGAGLALALLLLLLPSNAAALLDPSAAHEPLPNLDTRPLEKPSDAQSAADARLAGSLGALGFADAGGQLGGLEFAGSTGGYLSASADEPAADVALGFVADHKAAFALDGNDVANLQLTDAYTSDADGVRHLTFAQMVDGYPSFDTQLYANVSPEGRLINVSGGPEGGLTLDDPDPAISKHEALLAARDEVDGKPSGGFGEQESARLVAFAKPQGPAELAYDVYVDGGDSYLYEVVIGADAGEMLWRQSRTDFAADQANVYAVHPDFNTAPTTVNLAAPDGGRWVNDTAGRTRLFGNNVHAYADVNDSNTDGAGEDVPANGGGDWLFNETFFNQAECPAFRCTWDSTSVATKATNQKQNITQMFYLANRYHDHLLAAPIGFDEASGNYEQVNSSGQGVGGDPVLAEGNDGGGTNNANFSTVPDGTPGRMQMYFFSFSWDVNGTDDADVIFHEMTHGLSQRLDHNGSGLGAFQSGSMGEGWSDWYAEDYLVSSGLRTDGPGQDLTIGSYVINNFSPVVGGIRRQRMDCKPSSAATYCPAYGTAGAGGFTYGDLGKVSTSSVHDNGEIWSQTLWDLRERLGSHDALAVVTGGLRLSPVNPSFLQERDSILQAAKALGIARRPIWEVFANRGMGYSASTPSASATSATEAFDVPPRLQQVSRTITDPVPLGDGDGVAEPGETVRIADQLDNPVEEAATNVVGSMSTSSPAAVVGTHSVSYPNFPASLTTHGSSKPYTVTIPDSAPCGSDVPLATSVASAQGGSALPATSLAVGVPQFSTANPSAAIPDNNAAGVAVTMNLPAGTVNHMVVRLDSVSHTFVGDLKMTLKSPGGTTITLMDRPGGVSNSGDNFVNTVLDDSAMAPIAGIGTGGSYTSSFKPDQPLSTFDGEPQGGVWTLTVSDNANLDTGTINSWSLKSGATCSTAVPQLPAAATTGSSGIGAGSATLAGTVDPNGTATSYAFEYGKTNAYGSQTPAAAAGAGNAPIAKAAAVAGLAPNTTYHYRALALRSGTVVAAGADKTLKTQAAPVAKITSGPAAGATVKSTNSVTFGFSATPAGAKLECKLDGGAFAACGSPKTLSALSDGAHTFSVRGKSADGVAGATASRAFTVAFGACKAAQAAVQKATTAQAKAKKKLKAAKASHKKAKIKKAKKKLKAAKKKLKAAKSAAATAC